MDPGEKMMALWRETFGGPAPVKADAPMLSAILIQHLDPAPPYRPRPGPRVNAARRKP